MTFINSHNNNTRRRRRRRKTSTKRKILNNFQANYERVLFHSFDPCQANHTCSSKDTAANNNAKTKGGIHRLHVILKVIQQFRRHFLKRQYLEVHLQDGSLAAETVKALGLTQKHLRLLRKKFDLMDIDNSGYIDKAEFAQMFQQHEPNATNNSNRNTSSKTFSGFTEMVFSFLDLDNSGSIDFDEFVRVCTRYCMLTHDEILKFWFMCFDEDGSGAIDEDEFIELCKTVNYHSPMFPGNFSQALKMFDVNEDGLIDFMEFQQLNHRFPLILYPAFRLQDCMQKLTLGESSWADICKKLQQSKQQNLTKRSKRLGSGFKFKNVIQSILALNKRWKIHATLENNEESDEDEENIHPNYEKYKEILQQDFENHRIRTQTAARLRRSEYSAAAAAIIYTSEKKDLMRR